MYSTNDIEIELIIPTKQESVKNKLKRNQTTIKNLKAVVKLLQQQNSRLKNTNKKYTNVIQALSRKLAICKKELEF